jgi:hypothetical protein
VSGRRYRLLTGRDSSKAYAWAANMLGAIPYVADMSPANAYGFYIGWLQAFSDAGNRGGGGGPRYPRYFGEDVFNAWAWRVPFPVSFLPCNLRADSPGDQSQRTDDQ